MSKVKDKWCIHNTFSMDGVECAINKQKGYQCNPYDRATCPYYRKKEDKETKKKVKSKETTSTNTKNTKPQEISTEGTINSESYTINPPQLYGWVCPKCGRVNAPWKSTCDCHNGIATPYTPPNTPTPYYNPPIEIPNPFDPYGPYKWGDAPGWWNKGPTCKEGKIVFEIEYPDGHREECPPNYFSGLGTSIPCSTPTDIATSEEHAKKIIESNRLNTSTSNPNSNYTLKGKSQGE